MRRSWKISGLSERNLRLRRFDFGCCDGFDSLNTGDCGWFEVLPGGRGVLLGVCFGFHPGAYRGFGSEFGSGFGHDAFDEAGDGAFAFGGLAYFGARGEGA